MNGHGHTKTEPRWVESPEPSAERRAAPVWLFILFGLLFFWGTLYLDRHAGGFNPLVYEPYNSLADVDARHPKSESAALLAKGRIAFNIYCSVCHGPEGQGMASTGTPPLAGSDWVLTPGHGRLVRIILNAVEGPITVKGEVYNPSQAMTPFRDTILDDAELAALASFVRGNRAWGNTAAPVTAEQVKLIREQTAARGRPWTAPELQTVPETE